MCAEGSLDGSGLRPLSKTTANAIVSWKQAQCLGGGGRGVRWEAALGQVCEPSAACSSGQGCWGLTRHGHTAAVTSVRSKPGVLLPAWGLP